MNPPIEGMTDNLRVLIVEDVPTDAELVESELQDAGMAFSTKRVATKKAYLAALSIFMPHVILSDYSLPAFDGFTALKLRQELAPDTPFIFVTGALGEELAIDLLKQGATDYVLKNRLSRLPVAVKRALREVEERKERERAHRDLHESEERHRVTLQTAMDGFFLVDLEGRILQVNETYCRMSGYSEQELLGMNISDVEAVHDAETMAVEIRKTVELGPNRFETRHRRKGGSLFHVEVSAQFQQIAGGQAVVFVRDITERKLSEEALRRSEAYLAEGQRLAHMGSWAWDPATHHVIYWSEEMFRIFGLNPQDGVPTPETFRQRLHPEDRDDFQEFMMQVAHQSMDYEHEHRIVLPDGTIKRIHAVGHPFLDENGRLVEYVGTSMDVTERKRAEEALRLASAYNRSLIEASLDPLVTIDKEGRINDVNASTEQVTGYTRSDLIGTDFSDYFTEPEKARSGYRKVFSEGLVRDYELNIHHRDGKITPVIYNASVYRDEAGNPIGVFAAARDITERKKAEAEINSLKNYLSNIIDSMPSVLVGMDNTRTVTEWNRKAEAFTGIPAGEAIGKPIAHLLPDFAPWIISMGTGMDAHRPSSTEKLLIEKEGERRFYDLMLYPLLTDDVGGAVLRVEDVTERARTQELMIQTEKMMSIGGLAAGMAHEINNPLGIITQAAHNIERRISLELHANREVSEELGLNLEGIRAYFDKRQISDAIASIRTASSRAAKIVANMLQFSRRADTTMEFASLAQIVDQTLELAASDYDLKKHYDFRSIDIIKDYKDIPQVRIVSVEIEQVILNLLKNAAQAMTVNPPHTKPRITLRLGREDRYVVLDVEDNGPGMMEDIRRRVFEPFFTTKESGVGTGLGLSVSYMIVTQNHKGLMEVQSTPGRGTLFKVRLPIGEERHE